MSRAKHQRMKTHRSVLVCASLGVAAVLTLSGCAVMKNVAGATLGPAAGTGDQGGAVQKTFDSFEYSDCKEAKNALKFCSVTFMEKAGLIKEGQYLDSSVKIYNARAHMENLDKRWIPGWEKLPADGNYRRVKSVYATIATAAIRKNWAKKCTANYAKLHKEKLAPADADIAAKIEKARKLPNLHERIGALTKLRARFEPNSSSLADVVGGRYEVEKAIVEELRAADLEVLYHPDYLGIDEELAHKLRPRMSLEDEADAYCKHAALYGADGLPAVDSKKGTEFAASVYSKAQREAIDAKKAELYKKSAQVLALSDEASERLDGLKRGSIDSVHSVDQDDGKLVVIDSRTEDDSVVLGCKTLDKVERVHADGRVEYKKECRYANRKRVIQKRYDMPAMPEDVEISKGDTLSFYYVQTGQRHEAKKGENPKANDVYETYERQVLFVTGIGETKFLHKQRQ